MRDMDKRMQVQLELVIKKLEDLNIAGSEFSYEIAEDGWINIYHNIFDFIIVNDEVADKVSKILQLELIDKGITKFRLYEE